jgi:hypothetical protein
MVMKRLVALCALGLIRLAPGWAQTVPDQNSGPGAPPGPAMQGNPFPIEIAGYLSVRLLRDDDLSQSRSYRDYSASLFLSKTLGRWRFHAELNAGNAPEYDSDGIHLIPRRGDLSVKLDSGFVNYTASDSLQVEAGFLFIPTYWREHRYQSTVLTVDDPLIDQTVFPTAFKGGMVHGDRYFRGGGISYMAYGGVDQQTEFQNGGATLATEGARALGGKVVVHMPSEQFFDTFDIAFHALRRYPKDGDRDSLYGTELVVRKQRVELLAEFAHDSLDIHQGSRLYIREGFYLQPSYRLTKRLFAVSRYDRLNRDSRFADESSQARQSAGLTFRPVPTLSLKLEADRYQTRTGQHAYYGFTTGLVYFFHKP